MTDCRLCDLPTPNPPVRTADVEGEFCCRGCLEVARRLDDVGNLEMDEIGEAPIDGDRATIERAVPSDAAEAYLAVNGMHCTTCEAFLGLQGDDRAGIQTVEANYGTETARVVYDPKEIEREALPGALSGYGYTLRFQDETPIDDDSAADTTRTSLRKDNTVERLAVGGFLTMLIMPWYFLSLYPSYLGIKTNALAVDTSTSVGWYLPLVFIALLTTVLLGYTGAPLLKGAYVSVRARRPNMDLLVAVAALSAYAYSTLTLATGGTHLYYDVTVAVVMVVSLGRYYERRVRSQATDLLETVTAARVESATRLTETGSETVPIAELEPGDRVRVTPGERVPIDGTVIEGTADVDESVITGESLPVRKQPGEAVIGGATLLGDVGEPEGREVDERESAGAVVIRVGEDAESTADRLAAALWEVQTATPGIQRFVDVLATIFVPVVLTLGVLVAGWRLATGEPVAVAMLSGLTVLVVSCPCAMGLATPLAVSGGLRDALDRGVVVTDASVFEVAQEAKTVVFDKTGTLTAGKMYVSATYGDDQTLRRAAAVERRADHPIADAIRQVSANDQPPAVDTIEATTVESFTHHPGSGVSGTLVDHDVDGSDSRTDMSRIVVGTADLVERECGPVPEELQEHIEAVTGRGALPVVVGWNGAARGVIAVEDREREGWDEAIAAFADREVVVLTGDEGPRADRFRDHPAVDEIFAGVPPDGKLEAVRGFAAAGPTVMVGDGTNDAPALAAADLGIAMGDGTARAIEAADVVIADDDLRAVATVFDLATGTRRRIRENVAWALCYNAVAIPIAVAGALNPFFAALAMAASSGIVVTNSTRSVLRE